MPDNENPCANGLTPACFSAYPKWAKQALAYRLVNTIAPPAISRRLQKLLKGAWVFPGIIVAPDLVPPPGTVILPAPGPPPVGLPGEIPTGDQVPPPIDWNNPPSGSPFPNDFLGPWTPGPPRVGIGASPPGGFSQFYEPWTTLDATIWTLNPASRNAWKVSGGWLVSSYDGPEGPGSIFHTIAETLPVDLDIEIKVLAVSGTSNFVFYVYTGSVLFQITFRATAATNSVYLTDGSTIGTNNGWGTNNTWLLQARSDGWKLYRNGDLAAQNATFTESALTPGLVNHYSNALCYMNVDYLNIQKA